MICLHLQYYHNIQFISVYFIFCLIYYRVYFFLLIWLFLTQLGLCFIFNKKKIQINLFIVILSNIIYLSTFIMMTAISKIKFITLKFFDVSSIKNVINFFYHRLCDRAPSLWEKRFNIYLYFLKNLKKNVYVILNS